MRAQRCGIAVWGWEMTPETTHPEMKIRAIAPWFGGKRTLAPVIVEELGKHGQYFEPFCGSMAVLMAKDPCQKETVNDLHGDLINLARVVQNVDQAERLYDRLTRVIVCEQLLHEAGEYLEAGTADDAADAVERAYWYFLACWTQRNGVSGTDRSGYQIAVRWTKGGGSPTVRFQNAVGSLPAWHYRLQNVVIMNRDAFTILDRFEDCPETAIYVDPPCLADSRSGFESTSGEHSRYLHEFSHGGGAGLFDGPRRDDHRRLHEILSGYRKARIVVSYYDCPDLRRLYAGWTFRECTMCKNLGNVAKNRATAPEVLVINGPSVAGGTK